MHIEFNDLGWIFKFGTDPKKLKLFQRQTRIFKKKSSKFSNLADDLNLIKFCIKFSRLYLSMLESNVIDLEEDLNN